MSALVKSLQIKGAFVEALGIAQYTHGCVTQGQTLISLAIFGKGVNDRINNAVSSAQSNFFVGSTNVHTRLCYSKEVRVNIHVFFGGMLHRER